MNDVVARVSFDWTGAVIKVPLTINGKPGQPFEIPLERLAPGIVGQLQQRFAQQMGQQQLAGIAGIETVSQEGESIEQS